MFAALFIGCKPTEKNYQQAYDLAVQKREESLASVSGGTLDAMDGPHKRIVDGDTIMVATGTFKVFEMPENAKDGRFGLAVAKYGMHTNAREHAVTMREKYPDVFVATDGKKNYYVVTDRYADLKEAIAGMREFEAANPGFRYISLQTPVAILIVD